MSNERDIRQVRASVSDFRIQREENALPVITGYAAVFNSRTDIGPFTEEIAPGAFRDSLARKDDVRALFNHDANQILGRTTAGTLELREDEHGLFCRIIPPDTQLGRDLTVSIERGDISQMSFGFYIDEESYRQENGQKPHFTILRASLFDVSPVTFPAYPQTEVDIERNLRHRMATLRDKTCPVAELEKRKREISLLAS